MMNDLRLFALMLGIVSI